MQAQNDEDIYLKRSSGRKEERRRGREIYAVFILERGGDQRSFKLRPCGAKIATGDNRFQNGLPSYRHPCVPFLLLPLHLTHPLCPPTHRRSPFAILLLPVLSFHYIVSFPFFRYFLLFISDLSVHRYTDLCDSLHRV